jgi:Fe2+ or Zn2+ uptake regulation protein
MTAARKRQSDPDLDPTLPRNYRLIYDILRERGQGTHVSPGEILAEAKRRQPRFGYATVYRGLNRLCQLGLVAEIAVPGAESAVYEPASRDHAHFRCTRCGGLDDVDYTLSQRAVAALARRQGVDVTRVSLTLHGLCTRCRHAGSPARRPSREHDGTSGR